MEVLQWAGQAKSCLWDERERESGRRMYNFYIFIERRPNLALPHNMFHFLQGAPLQTETATHTHVCVDHGLSPLVVTPVVLCIGVNNVFGHYLAKQ